MRTCTRTHNCGELRASHIGGRATLCGWVNRRRDHGGLIFIDLRDRFGLTQLVFSPDASAEAHTLAEGLRSEFVIAATGTVRRRPPETTNPKLATGEVELYVEGLTVLAEAETPPFTTGDDAEVGEDLRLKYRYLDLRRPGLQNALILRHRVMLKARNFLDRNGFIEIETPMLTKSTPEGARDYLVPSRTHPGSFFALPQSPQLMKQLLMIAGMDRYFQICKCFRDEDLRADRQPEFSQIDMEMSFADEEDIFSVLEGLMVCLFKAVMGADVRVPFPRLTHREALRRFGTDKPDMRFSLELEDVTDVMKGSRFRSFEEVCAGGGRVKGFSIPGYATCSRSRLDELTRVAVEHGAGGLAWLKVRADGVDSPVAKFFEKEQLSRLCERLTASDGDLVLLVADELPVANAALSSLRTRLGRELGLLKKDDLGFVWIVDFPLFTYSEEEGRYESEHHPFTAPKSEDIPLLKDEPLRVCASSYDLVLNGNEIASGSVRIHDAALQRRIFELLKLDESVINERFGFFLEALRYGAPPHAGAAIGLDRLVMIMAGRETIRDVIGFPKTQKASCLMTGSPSHVGPEQLKELHLRIK